jgi:Sec-independent protein translocase protein TatA
MLSIPDMALLGAAALLLFGPEQLPRVARKAGNVMREIQNTSQSFIREMERAADLQDVAAKPYEPPPYDPVPYEAAASETHAYDAAADDLPPYETQPYDDAPTVAMRAVEPPEPAPERPAGAGEKLAEPRPALDLIEPAPPEPAPAAAPSRAAEPPPEIDHAAHL